MVTHTGNLAVFHDNDDVGILNGGNTLGNDQLGGSGNFFLEGLADHSVRMGIHSGGRVVQDQDLRLFQQGTGNAQPLLLAAGDIAAPLLDVGIVAVREGGDELIGTGQLTGVDQLLIRGVGIAPAQVFLDGAGEQGVLLQHHGHIVPEHLRS